MNTFIVFDLDETIGYFTQFGIIWESMQQVFNNDLNQEHFNCLLDLYPNYLRPNILTIFRYLIKIKKANHNLKIILYTNNQGPKSWSNFIINYVHKKINYELFDQLIYAYKVNGRHIEYKRTTHNKTYSDFKRCVDCGKYNQICFIDDQYHPYMNHKNIYYLNIKPYYYDYNIKNMLNTFFSSECYKTICSNLNYKDNRSKYIKQIDNYINSFQFIQKEKTESESKIDKVLSKKLMFHIQKFIKLHLNNKVNNVTMKNKSKKNKSKKNKSKKNKSKKND